MKKKDQEQREEEELTESQKERFNTIRQVLRIHIDGDWDEDMIQAAFDNLEKLLCGLDEDGEGEANRGRSNSKRGRATKKNRRGVRS